MTSTSRRPGPPSTSCEPSSTRCGSRLTSPRPTPGDRIQAGIASVQKAQARAKTQLDQAAKSGQDTWQSTAEQAEQTVSDVGAQLQTLVEQLQGSVGAAAPAARRAWSTFLDEWNRQRSDRQRLLDEG